MTGIDISKWNGEIDFSKVAENVDFVIIRAGYGKNNIDPYLYKNLEGCEKNSIPFGFYWFSYAYTEEMAKNEARYFMAAIGDSKPEFPLYWDFEGDTREYAEKCGVKITKELACKMAKAFCETLENNGFYAGIYCNVDDQKDYFDDEIEELYTIWTARYSDTRPNNAPIWQYTSTGKISGISGNVDLNMCYKDFPTVIKTLGFNGWQNTAYIENNKFCMNGRAIEIKYQKESENAIIRNNGCGYCCASFLLDFYGISLSPEKLYEIAVAIFEEEGKAISSQGIGKLLRHVTTGGTVTVWNTNVGRSSLEKNITESLTSGNPIILYINPNKKTIYASSDHYIVLFGWNRNGDVLVANPGTSTRYQIGPLSDILDIVTYTGTGKDKGFLKSPTNSFGAVRYLY